MNDRELCELFGTTLEKVEADVEKYERGDFSDFAFGTPIEGKPETKMRISPLPEKDPREECGGLT